MSILKDLFCGDILPSEHIIPIHAKYRENNKKTLDEMDYWQHKLSKEDFTKLESLYDLWSEASAMVEEHSFIYGFRLGSLLIMELLCGNETPGL